MIIRIVETVAKSGSQDLTNVFPHGLRGVLPRACLPAGEAVATAGGSSDAPRQPSYSGAAFVNEWIGPGHKPAPVVRDFTFKAVIGEPEW